MREYAVRAAIAFASRPTRPDGDREAAWELASVGETR